MLSIKQQICILYFTLATVTVTRVTCDATVELTAEHAANGKHTTVQADQFDDGTTTRVYTTTENIASNNTDSTVAKIYSTPKRIMSSSSVRASPYSRGSSGIILTALPKTIGQKTNGLNDVQTTTTSVLAMKNTSHFLTIKHSTLENNSSRNSPAFATSVPPLQDNSTPSAGTNTPGNDRIITTVAVLVVKVRPGSRNNMSRNEQDLTRWTSRLLGNLNPKSNFTDGTFNLSNVTNHSTSEQETGDSEVNPLIITSREVYKYGMTLIFIFGVVGNSLIILIIYRGKTGRTSSSLYLLALAVLDQYIIVAAVFGSHVIRSFTGFDYIRASRYSCKVAYFTIVTCAQSSVWLVAIMCFERALVLTRPMRFKDKFNKKTTRVILCITVLFWTLKNLHMFWSNGAEYKRDENGTLVLKSECGFVQGPLLDFNIRIRPWIDYAVTFTAALVILISNIIIVCLLLRSKRLRRASSNKGHSGTHHHLMAMLVTVSISFLVFALPLQIVTILVPRNPNDVKSEAAGKASLLWSLGLLMSYANSAVNFYIYCASCRMFRHDLVEILTCRIYKEKEATSHKSMSGHVKSCAESATVNSETISTRL